MRVLVTGVAGAIGAEVAVRLLARGDEVLGVDCFTPYYDITLKQARLARVQSSASAFQFSNLDIGDVAAFRELYRKFKPDRVVHLAAQPGVRYSITHPEAYIHCNLNAFLSVLEACRHEGVEHLVYASSSSVYGTGANVPYSVSQNVDHPISLYAATKKANELIAHSYSHLYGLPTTGLRFFTVYGPWGRPDMSVYLFADRIVKGLPIELFHFGKHKRDFTFIEDIAEGVIRVMDKAPTVNPHWNSQKRDPATSSAPYRIYNIGNESPVEVLKLVSLLEQALDKRAITQLKPMQPGDVEDTFADVSALEKDFGFSPSTSIETGVERFVRWYRDYHRV